MDNIFGPVAVFGPVAALAVLLAVWFLLQRAVAVGFCCLGLAAGCLAVTAAGIHWLLTVPFCILTFGFLETGYADYRLMRTKGGHPDWGKRKRRIYKVMAIYVVLAVVASAVTGTASNNQEPEGRAPPASAKVRKPAESTVKAQPARNEQSINSARNEVRMHIRKESAMNVTHFVELVLVVNIIVFAVVFVVAAMRRSRRRENVRKIVAGLDGISGLTPEGDEGDSVRTHLTAIRGVLKMLSLALVFVVSGCGDSDPIGDRLRGGSEAPAAEEAMSGPPQVEGATFVLVSEKVIPLPDGTAEYRPTTTNGHELRFAGTLEECRAAAGKFVPGDRLSYVPGNSESHLVGTLELHMRTSAFRKPMRQDLIIVQDGGPAVWQSALRDIATLRVGEVITKLRVEYDAPEFPGGKNQVIVEIRKREEGPAREFLKNMKAGLVTFWLLDYTDVVELPSSFDMRPPTAYTAGYKSSTSVSTVYPLVQYDDKGTPYLVTVPEGIKFNDMVVLKVTGFPTSPAVGTLEPGKITWPGDRSRIDARIQQRLGGGKRAALSKRIASVRAEFDSLTAPVLEFPDDERLQSLRRVLKRFRDLNAPDTTRAEEVIHHRVEELQAQLQAGAAAAEAERRQHEAERRQQQQLEQQRLGEVVNNLTTFNELAAKKRLNKDEARSLEAAIDALQDSSHDVRPPSGWPTRSEFEKARKKAHRFSR